MVEEADEGDEPEVSGASYQLDMMRNLREVNVDNNTVGWYQSTYLGSYQTVDFIETFLTYQVRRGRARVQPPRRRSR